MTELTTVKDELTPATAPEETTFAGLGLREELLGALTESGYDSPTAIQRQAIPAAIEGRDVLGCAQTGTGKTAAFALPILQRLTEIGRASCRERV